jgi:hypothetical protein
LVAVYLDYGARGVCQEKLAVAGISGLAVSRKGESVVSGKQALLVELN